MTINIDEFSFKDYPISEGLFYQLINRIQTQATTIRKLQAENTKAWSERNEAVTRVKSWEDIVVIVHPLTKLKAVEIKDFGEGKGDLIGVRLPTNQKLIDVLEELRELRAMK